MITRKARAVTGTAAGRRTGRTGRTGSALRAVTSGLTATGLVLGAASGASAYWRAGGTGSATATTGTAATLSTSISTTGLYPGGSQSVTFTLTASGGTNVTITSIPDGSSNANGSCAAGTVTLHVTDALPVAMTSGSVTLHGTATMITTASNSCQGLSLSVPLTITGKQ